MHRTKLEEIAVPETSAEHQLPDELSTRLLMTPVEAGARVGWAKQTVYNKLNDEIFPIPLVEFCGRKMVKTSDLLEYVNKLPYVKRLIKKPGRPTKAESILRYSEKKEGAL